MKRIDLHTHSRYSDGTALPSEVVSRAAKAGVELLFLTDHDSVAGFPEAKAAAAGTSVRVHCGVEINTRHGDGDRVHILGYSLGWKGGALEGRLEDYRARRLQRLERILAALKEHGVELSLDEVRGGSRQSLGRPHVADALIRKGVVKSRQEAFNRFLTRGKPGFVESMGPTPEEAIGLIREAGGLPVLAHPQTAGDLSGLKAWVAQGLGGLEARYAAHRPSEVKRFGDIAKAHGLVETGGSDYHGPGTGRDEGLGVDVPDAVADGFLARLERCS